MLDRRFRFNDVHLAFAFLFVFLASSTWANSAPTIGTASNFKSTMGALEKAQAKNWMLEPRILYASSGKLLAQIKNGAPIDIFFSAEPIAEKLPANLVVESSEFTYAIGQLALVTHTDMTTLSFDQTQKISCIAIANPKLAPYGRAAMEVVAKLEQRDWRFERIVQGQSVAQAFQFFDSGACEAALVAFAQVKASNKPVHSILIPSEWHAPIQQNAVLLRRAADNTEAIQFLEFLKTETARNIIRDAGYLTDLE